MKKIKSHILTINGERSGMVFEVGKTYTFKGDIEKNGFVYGENVVEFASGHEGQTVTVFEIEVLGETVPHQNFLKTDKLKIVKKVTFEEFVSGKSIVVGEGKSRSMCKFNDRGKLIRATTPEGELVQTLDEIGNVVYSVLKNAHGLHESWYSYNDQGKMTKYRNSAGEDSSWDYDEKGNIISFRSIDGINWDITID